MRIEIVIVLKYFDGSVTFPRIWCYFACGMSAALFRLLNLSQGWEEENYFEVFVSMFIAESSKYCFGQAIIGLFKLFYLG